MAIRDDSSRGGLQPVATPVLGIDLGTTFSAVAYVAEDGRPRVITSAAGSPTTPSVIWTDGRQAWIGQDAIRRKEIAPEGVVEFVKRAMGRPVVLPPGLEYEPGAPVPAPFEIGGFKFGAAGMSALILRKLKKEAVRHFQREGLLEAGLDEANLLLDAVITVPAYFGDIERQQTRLAGSAAGLRVQAIINEPTAAALAYGHAQPQQRHLMVFDLGGGTFDVTILRANADGSAEVLASEGDRRLGGKDIDEVIQSYLYDAFLRANGTEIPLSRAFEVQRHALEAKLALSAAPEARVQLSFPEGDLDVTLQRARSESTDGAERAAYDLDIGDTTFYFEDRIQSFLQRCRVLCARALERTAFETPTGTRPMTWGDLDEIVLAGGSCRIPVVRRALMDWSGMPVRQPDTFDLDTAVALGAALYGAHRERVKDVVSHSVGVELIDPEGRLVLDHLLKKNEPLPAHAERSYPAPANAGLKVYQGESRRPDEALLRGSLALGNPKGRVAVTLRADMDGTLAAEARWDDTVRSIPIENALYDFDDRAQTLRDRVLGIHINL